MTSKAQESIGRERVARWMIRHGYATGHGDSIEGLLEQLIWQIQEQEKEKAAQMCEAMGIEGYGTLAIAASIRAKEKR